jgi:hypothetical protein
VERRRRASIWQGLLRTALVGTVRGILGRDEREKELAKGGHVLVDKLCLASI